MATPADRGTGFAADQTVMIALATSGPGTRLRTGLSICIPVYNERDAIAETLERCLALKAELKRVGVDELEVIAVDDGSKARIGGGHRRVPRVRLIRHQVNRGYGAALKTGMAAASHDLIAFLDGDGTYPPESFPTLFARSSRTGRTSSSARGWPARKRKCRSPPHRQPVLRAPGDPGRPAASPTASGMRVIRVDPRGPLAASRRPALHADDEHARDARGLHVVELPIPYASGRAARS